jgi:hypothetical protein
MKSIDTTLEAQPDGTLHLPLPEEMRHGKVKVTATLVAVEGATPSERPRGGFGRMKGKIELAPDFDAPLDDFREYAE